MDFPESELVRSNFTIRAMDLPPQVKMTKRSMLRWLALSLGLITPGESRSSLLDVLEALFFMQFTKQISPTSNELLLYLNDEKKGISDKLLRYHLKRLKDVKLIESKKLKYSFKRSPFAEQNDLRSGFQENMKKEINNSLNQIEEVLVELKNKFEE
jgi:DNA-binding transcriptional ArsR family regulator